MNDPVLNRQIEETAELRARWGEFREFLRFGPKLSPGARIDAERGFLALKTRICLLHDGFMETLRHDRHVGQQALGVMGACVTLRHLPSLSETETRKLELDWNAAYMLMTETLATLEERRHEIAGINERAYRIRKARETLARRFHEVTGGFWFRVFFIFVALPSIGLIFAHRMGLSLGSVKSRFPKMASSIESLEEKARDAGVALDYESIPPPAAAGEFPGSKLDKGVRLTRDEFVSNLLHLGFSTAEGEANADFRRAVELMRGARQFKSQGRQMVETKRWGMAYLVLFNNSAEAEEFCKLRRRGLESHPHVIQDRVNERINLCRRRNFVAIFASEEKALRVDLAKSLWDFKESEMGR